jgi:hypothetical protein
MPRGKFNLKSARVTAKVTRGNVSKTRKQARFLQKMDKKMRILQGAIAGQVAADAVQELQVAGVLPAPAAGADPLDVPVNAEQVQAVVNAAALQADRPNILLREFGNVRAHIGREVRRFSARDAVNLFMMIALAFYVQFPLHAAPRERSFFDVAAGHLSLASTATGFIGMSAAGPLGTAAYGVKALGKKVRNYNARTGRFPNTPANAVRREVDLLEYDPSIGTGLTVMKLAAAVPGVAFNAATGARGRRLEEKALARVMKTAADTAKNLGDLVGIPEDVAVSKMKAAGTVAGAAFM